MTIKVLIVDDSAVVREVMQSVLSKQPDIKIIGTAPDPIFAMERMKKEWPDVITLDIEMPRMDGVTFLKRIMAERPTPVVICSSLAERGADVTIEALAAGAMGIITKPSIGVRDFIQDSSADVVTAVRAAAQSKVGLLKRPAAAPGSAPASALSPTPMDVRGTGVAPKLSADAVLDAPPSGSLKHLPTTDKFVAIGCSTGGTQALEEVLTQLPASAPAIVIVQHMPEAFTKSFAKRLDSLCRITVKEATSGDRVINGQALIAPGGKHMVVKRNGAQYFVDVIDGPLVSRHRPSVDVLFRSVALAAGKNATGFILTGMGDDGARGMKEMHDVGAITYAQDEATCVVFGMPKEAIARGGVDHVVPLDKVPGLIARVG